MQKKEISYERNGVLKCLRLFITITLMATTLLTHAQCMRVHYNDGWTEQIDVTTVDSITFDENGQHLAPTIMLNNGLRMPAFGIGTYSLHGETCFNSVYTALKNGYTEVNITEENGVSYLNALYKGKKPICERVLKLDAERYQKGDLPLANLLSKYCSYIAAGHQSISL
ncbi:MAG: hypothetical protein IJ067_05165 [Prevotella sp.]|nr:hypothetical protein [Prevotella sp.]